MILHTRLQLIQRTVHRQSLPLAQLQVLSMTRHFRSGDILRYLTNEFAYMIRF